MGCRTTLTPRELQAIKWMLDAHKPQYRAPVIESLKDAEEWVGRLDQRSISDIASITKLYERTSWLARPWWRRAFRKPPWLRR